MTESEREKERLEAEIKQLRHDLYGVGDADELAYLRLSAHWLRAELAHWTAKLRKLRK